MQSLFSPDSKIMQALSFLCDLILLNVLFLFTCIPIFTIGASSAALYDVCFRMGTERETGLFRAYFRGFRENFKQGTIIWLLVVLFTVISCVNLTLFVNLGGNPGFAGCIFIGCLLALAVLISGYAFPLLSRFSNDTKSTLKNALLLSVGYLPRSLLIAGINLLPLALLLLNLYTFLQAGFLWVFLYFSAGAFLNCRLLNKVFAPYLSDKEESR